MKVFLVYVRDENFYRLLPKELDRSNCGNGRIKVMGFPPLGIQTLAPVLRRHGHQVRIMRLAAAYDCRARIRHGMKTFFVHITRTVVIALFMLESEDHHIALRFQ